MEYNLKTQNQIGFFYNAATKPLYNLALYTMGDPVLAQQVTIDAFVGSFHSISDKADLELFMNKSIKLLYQYIRKVQKNNGKVIPTTGDIYILNGEKNKNMDMLCKLSPDERYILLLFCWQRFSIKRIAEAISLPRIIVKKRLYAVLNKVVKEL